MTAPTLRDHARALAAGFADLLWPRACLVCDRRIDADALPGCVCAGCRDALLADTAETCPRCASTVGPHADVDEGCSRCRGVTLRFEGVLRLGAYDGVVRDAVVRAKREDAEPLAEELGRLLVSRRGDELRRTAPGVVVPVPLHWWKRWERGYNQAEALARGVADALCIACRPRCLARTRSTPSQVGRSPAMRWENVRGAFRVRSGADLRGVRVLLIDDVLTTGATASAAAGALRDAGAAQVTVAVVAHR